jgi:hypothetical protein
LAQDDELFGVVVGMQHRVHLVVLAPFVLWSNLILGALRGGGSFSFLGHQKRSHLHGSNNTLSFFCTRATISFLGMRGSEGDIVMAVVIGFTLGIVFQNFQIYF